MQPGRRLFFQTLLGLPAVAAAARAKPAPVLAETGTHYCECGHAFVRKDLWTSAGYLVCLNRRCRHYQRPLAIPTIALTDADPALVARVRKEQEAQRKRGNLDLTNLQSALDDWKRQITERSVPALTVLVP